MRIRRDGNERAVRNSHTLTETLQSGCIAWVGLKLFEHGLRWMLDGRLRGLSADRDEGYQNGSGQPEQRNVDARGDDFAMTNVLIRPRCFAIERIQRRKPLLELSSDDLHACAERDCITVCAGYFSAHGQSAR